MTEENSHITPKVARTGIDMDSSVSQIPNGKLSYALNAALENFDQNSTSYQNEPANEFCCQFPTDFRLIGKHFIPEQNKHIFFLTNPNTGDSQVGYMDNNDCIYHTYIESKCLAFDINFPIHKSVHKITNCTTEIYWTDGKNPRRFLDLAKIPYITTFTDTICDVKTTKEIDCNKLKIQPNFSIPQLEVVDVINGGDNIAGTYQFAIQYSDAAGDGYTSYYSITNPTPLANTQIDTLNFNYNVNKSIVLDITDIDITGYYKYYNVAVIKTINNIASVELIGTYFIDAASKQIIYSGQSKTQIKLTIDDIFEKFPYYDIAQDVTAVQDILVWDQLTSIDRINYQQIASGIKLYWETYRIPANENYSNELNATNLRGYLRDEIYAFEIVFLLDNGKQTDGFHIPGRASIPSDLVDVLSTNEDFVGKVDPITNTLPYWKIYNTASVITTDPDYVGSGSYKGPYQYGEFAYWESTDIYPCNEDVWGNLAGQPIRHHKFPDCLVSPHFESSIYTSGSLITPVMEDSAVFPIGVRLDVSQVQQLIVSSNLTSAQKSAIIGFKIVRGDRSTNKSIVAKGILRNVGKYTREGTDYYFSNYPYNDLNSDPFLLEKSNAYNSQCITYQFTATSDGAYNYTDCFTNTLTPATFTNGEIVRVCSLTGPEILTGTHSSINIVSYDSYLLTVTSSFVGFGVFTYINTSNVTVSVKVDIGNPITVQVKQTTSPHLQPAPEVRGTAQQINSFKNVECYPTNLSAFSTDDSKYRMVFNSPETSFGQPFLGDVLKLEDVIFGGGKAHFVQVKKNALYKLLTREAQNDALNSSRAIANITAFSGTAMFTAYQAYLTIYINGITRKNYGWSYNSIASYNYNASIDNGLGIKQRELDVCQYLIPTVQSVNDNHSVNNWNRESSIYIKTDENKSPFDFPSRVPSLIIPGNISAIEDKSRYINSQKDCTNPTNQFDISTVSYYGAIKDIILNQWGQMYSYNTIDTGFQVKLDNEQFLLGKSTNVTIFGGDTFISKFGFKTKLPFFIDNRVGAPDDSDINYDELGNVAYPQFWHSARSILYNYALLPTPGGDNLISVKAHYFDCPNSQLPGPPVINPSRSYYDGKIYMFAYGIPAFYCETSINVDLRQAFNNREGDFWPHVTKDIPDDWVQEYFVPILQDNTYYYNVSYSKQNKENFFSHLPIDWKEQLCFTHFPFRAIYSDPQQSFTDNRINSWLIYRPISYFDFPQNYGKLTSLDGIQNKAILARFENKSLLYNTLLTINTSNPKAAYLGNDSLFRSAPPVDFAETDLGFVGSQHKFLLKIPQGQITVDAKRGQVFLISGNGIQDLSRFGSGLNRFFTDHLAFEILRYFPTVNIDNNFNGIGLHGVYDSKYDRVIISKLDYIPLSEDIKYDEDLQKFYIIENSTNIDIKKYVDLTDRDYFCNKSWTLSYNTNTQSWVSFHSYIPNWYIAENNFFYSGINEGCDLEAIAVQEVPTTTTTSTSTTINPFDCNLDGNAHPVNCELDGFVLGTTTTTTTMAPMPDCFMVGNALLQ